MKKETKQQRVVRALLAAGSSEVAATSRKYRQFTRPSGTKFYFVGKMGALRVGSCASKSVSLEYALPKFLAKWAPVNVETAVWS